MGTWTISGPSPGQGRMEQPGAGVHWLPAGSRKGGCAPALCGCGQGRSCLSPVSSCATEESLSKLSRKEWGYNKKVV